MNLTRSLVLATSVVAMAAATAQAQPYLRTQPYRVNADTLNVRSGPSTSNAVVGKVTKGQIVQVYAIRAGWASVRIDRGSPLRYVFAKYVTQVRGAAPNAPQPAAPSSVARGTYETTTGLNLRSGPATSNRIVAVMPKGAKVRASARSGSWLRVTYDGTTGFAFDKYLRPVGTTSPPARPAESPALPSPQNRPSPQTRPQPRPPVAPATRSHVASYQVKTPYSVARAAPRRSASEVTRLRKGDRFRSVRSALGGYYIGFLFQGRLSWVVKTSLERTELTNALDTRTGKPTGRTLYRLKSNQDLHAGPTGARKDAKLGRLLKGTLVTATRFYDPSFVFFRSWRLVSAEGRRGWIQARHLAVYKPAPKPPEVQTTLGRATSGLYVLGRTTRLTIAPTSRTSIRTLRRGSRVVAKREVRVRGREWVLLSFAGRDAGWALRSNLRLP
jgi:uncharacterized protein YraI